MAGYSGQEIALDALTPTELEQQQATADLTQAQSQLARASMPDEIRYRKAQADYTQEQASAANLANMQNMAEWGLRQRMAAFQRQRAAMPGSSLASASPTAPQSQLAIGDADGPQWQSSAAPQTSPLISPMVDTVMQSIDPNDPKAAETWDQRMDGLSNIDPSAKQFIGHYSADNLKAWREKIGASAAAGAASQAVSSQAASSPLATPAAAPAGAGASGISADDLAANPVLAEYAALFPEKAKAYVESQGQLRFQQTGNIAYLKRYAPKEYAELARATESMNTAQKTAIEAKASEVGSVANAFLWMANKYGVNSPEARGAWKTGISQLANDGVVPVDEARKMLAKPPDIDWATVGLIKANTVQTWYKISGQEAANEQAAKVANPEPQYSTNQVDANGNLIITNAHAAPGQPVVTVTGVQAGARPSAGAMTAQAKQAMLIDAGVDPREAALMAAGQRPMDPQRVAIAAHNAALREQFNTRDPVTGKSPIDVNQRTAEIEQELSGFAPAAGAGVGGGGGVPGGGAPPNKGQYSPVQRQVTAAFVNGKPLNGATFDRSAKIGTPQNPYVPRSKAEVYGYPNGSIYIDRDGQPRIKGGIPKTRK